MDTKDQEKKPEKKPNEQGDILTTAETTLVFIDMKTNRPIRAPQYILDLIDV